MKLDDAAKQKLHSLCFDKAMGRTLDSDYSAGYADGCVAVTEISLEAISTLEDAARELDKQWALRYGMD